MKALIPDMKYKNMQYVKFSANKECFIKGVKVSGIIRNSAEAITRNIFHSSKNESVVNSEVSKVFQRRGTLLTSDSTAGPMHKKLNLVRCYTIHYASND